MRVLTVLTAALIAGCSSSTSDLNTDNYLSGLTISAGTLSPAFSAVVSSYGATVPNTTTSVTVTATTSSDLATVKVNGVEVTSGTASAAVALLVGPNLIGIAVYAEDGGVRSYAITVQRQ